MKILKNLFVLLLFSLELFAAQPTVTITSDKNNTVANGEITFTITFSEDVTGFDRSDITITNIDGDGDFWGSGDVYRYKVQPALNPGEGYIRVDIAAGVAKNNNNETNKAATTYFQQFDVKKPTLLNVKIESNNANGSNLAKVGDEITLSFRASEPLKENPTVKIMGNNSTFVSKNNNDYTFVYTMQASDNEGNVSFIISNITDQNNNEGTDVTTVTDSSYVTFDKTPPTVTITLSDNKIAKNETSTVTFQFSEDVLDFNISDINTNASGSFGELNKISNNKYTVVFIPDNNKSYEKDRNITVNTNYTDKAGNTGNSGVSSTFELDTQPPGAPTQIDLNDASDSGISNADNITKIKTPIVRVDLNGTHAVAGDILKVYVGDVPNVEKTLNTNDINNNYCDISLANLGADGNKTLKGEITDVVGNVGPKGGDLTITLDTTIIANTPDLNDSSDSGASDEDNITNDSTPTFEGGGTNDDNVTLFIGETNVGSAIIAHGKWSITPTNQILDGTYDVKIKAKDKAGNEATSQTLQIKIDTTSFIDANNTTNTISEYELLNNGLSISGNTDIENGQTIKLTFNKKEYSTTDSNGTNFTINIGTFTQDEIDNNFTDGSTYTIEFDNNLTDKAGNTAATTSKTIIYDKIANSSKQATALELNTTATSKLYDFGNGNSDVDYYKITLPSRGFLNVSTNTTVAKVSINDFNDDTNSYSDRNDSVNIFENVMDKGVYYIRVFGDTNDSYSLTATFTQFDLEIDSISKPRLRLIDSKSGNIEKNSLKFLNESHSFLHYNNGSYYDINGSGNLNTTTVDLANTTKKTKVTTHDGYSFILDNNITKVTKGGVTYFELDEILANDFMINNNYIYTIGDEKIAIYDITNKTNIKLLGTYNYKGNSIVVNDRYAYVGSDTNLSVFDIRQDLSSLIDDVTKLDILPFDKNVSMNNYAGENDTDIFKVITNKTGKISFISSGVKTGNNLKITVDNNSDFSSPKINNTVFNNTTIDLNVSAGTYYVKIVGNDNIVDGKYNLKATFTTTDNKIDKIQNYIFANDDINLSTTTQTITGNLINDSDIDLFKIVAPYSGVIDINVSGGKNVSLVKAKMYKGDDFSKEENITIGHIKSGVYFIKVSGSSGNYDLNVTFSKDTADSSYINTSLYDEEIGEINADIISLNIEKSSGEVTFIKKINDNYTLDKYDIYAKKSESIDLKLATSVDFLASAIYEKYIYFVYRKNNKDYLRILDGSNRIFEPIFLKDLNISDAQNNDYRFDFSISNKLVLKSSQKTYDINITDKSNPTISSKDGGWSNDVKKGDITYSLDDTTGVNISSGGTISSGGVRATTMTIIDDFLYIGTQTKGIYVYNIKTPTSPKFIRQITLRQRIVKLDSFGTKLFIISSAINDTTKERLDIIDVSNDYSNYKLESSLIYQDINISGTVVKDDIDYFNIMLNATGDLNVTIDSNDINCTISDKNGSISKNCNEIISNLPSGLYYIKLENIDTNKTTKYNFSVSQTYDDHIDTLNYDSKKKHTLVDANQTMEGNISTTSDKDIFKIDIATKASLKILELNEGFSVKVYYNGGDEIRAIGNSYDIYKPGTYYIEISNTTTTGDYSFKVSLETNKALTFVDNASSQNKYLSTINTNGNIQAIKVLGNYIYMVDDVDGFVVLDISNINKPEIISKISLFGKGKNITIEGSYAFISEGEDGIEIFDISDKSNIRFIGSYNTLGDVFDIAVDSKNDRIYLADGTNGVVKLNIENPSNPILDKTITSSNANSLFIHNSKLYVSNSDGLKLYTTDNNNTLIKTISGDFNKIIKNNNRLYAVVAKTIKIYDISSDDNVTQIGVYYLSSVITDGTISNIAYIDGLLYTMIEVSQTEGKLVVLDVITSSDIKLERVVSDIQSDGKIIDDLMILNDVDNSLDNLFYAKKQKLHILELTPDYSDGFKDAQVINEFPYIQKGQILTSRKTDKDIFRFSTKYTGKITIELKQTTVDGKISLYNESSTGMATAVELDKYNDIDWSSIAPIVSDSNITDYTLNQGTFYIVIEDNKAEGAKTGGNYELNVDFNTTGDKFADVIDENIVNYVSINGGVVEDSLFIGGGDKDFIDINVTDRINLTFTLSGEIKPRITLFYKDGTQMNISTDKNATSFTTELSAGSYKVRFDGYNTNDEGNYKVKLSTTPVDDILVENGLSEVVIDGITDVNYLGNNIYVTTQNSVARYTHLLKKLTKEETNFIANNTNISDNKNYKLFTYASKEENTIINYVVTTTLDGLKPIISTVTMDTLEIEDTKKQANIAPEILPYLKIKHISQNELIYMYDGSTLQIRKIYENDNSNMRAYSFANMKDIIVISNSLNDIIYLSDTNGGFEILQANIKGDGTVEVVSKSGYTKIYNEIGAMFVDVKNNRLYMGVDDGDKKLIYYDISDITNIIKNNNELSFDNEEYEGIPSDIYARDDRIYAIIPAKGIVVIDLKDDGALGVYKTVLNLGKDIDNIFSADGRTLNYTNVENNSTRLKIYFFEDSFQDGETDSVYTSLKDGNEPAEGCFIATAAYGSYFENHVKVLREFRDNILLTNSFGKQIVSIYYKYSPNIAAYIATNESLKVAVRILLTPIVYIIKYPLYILFGFIILIFIKRVINQKGVVAK